MNCSLPGSSIHGILQARILEWIAISFSRGSFQARDWTWVSCISGKLFTTWAREPSQNHLPKLPPKATSQNYLSKPLRSDGSNRQFYQTFKHQAVSMLQKFVRKFRKPRTISNSFYEASITLEAKPDKDKIYQKRLIYTSVSLLLSRTQVYCYHLSKFHIYALIYCIRVFLSGLLHSV